MPQLDITSFLSQIFWLLLFFWLFYFISFNFVTPLVVQALKYRTKKNNVAQDFIRTVDKEIARTFYVYDVFFGKSCLFCSSLAQKSFSNISSWAFSLSQKINSDFSFNFNYLISFLELSSQLSLANKK
ncbi:MAG: hypothetical protein CMJ31_06945 [Phycisphaerae bacterium]|nr:hypothetical protein [Phycisphaerae bacterium]|tara:strand:+ start:6864 stop:7247 length:384 start_codon:yes stop_codon:yes gene_type:complete